MRDEVTSLVAGVPGLSGKGNAISTAVQSGEVGQVIKTLPRSAAAKVEPITRAAFTSGLNLILLIGAILALASAVVSVSTIRSKDFARQG